MSEPSREQLMDALRRADAAGDEAAARAIARRLSGQQKPKEKPTSFLQGVGEGVGDVASNALSYVEKMPVVGAGLQLVNPIVRAATGRGVRDNLETYRQDRFAAAPKRGSTAGKIVGQIAGTLPTGGALRSPALAGALGGALVTSDPNNAATVTRDAAIGAAAGKAGDVVGRRVIAPVARKIAAPIARAVGAARGARPPVAVSPINPSIADDVAPLGRAAAMRAARLRASGVQAPTTGMVTRDPRAWQFERETAKRMGLGDEVLGRVQAADEGLVKRSRQILNTQGGDIGDEATGKKVVTALADKYDELGKEVSSFYKKVRAERGDVTAGRLDRLREVLDSPEMMDNPTFDMMREGVNRRLQRFGMAGNSGLLRKDSVASVSQAEELRKMIGKLGSSNDPTVRAARGQLIEALDDDVVSSLGDDAFKEARGAAKARFDEFKGTFAGKIAEDARPEQLTERLLRKGTGYEDLRQLRQSLTTGNEKQVARGQKAMQALRGKTVSDYFRSVTGPEGNVRGSQARTVFDDNAARYREILDPQAYKDLRRWAYAAHDAQAQVPYSAVNNSNTSASVGNMLFPEMPVGKGGGLLGTLTRRATGLLAGGPAGYAAVDAGEMVAKEMVSRKAAQTAAKQIGIALDPAKAAQVYQLMQSEAADAATKQAAQAWMAYMNAAAGAGAVGLLNPP
jgi:hypothetical protein